ncbi:hypothetical protein [Ruegeria sp. HKCCD8929]|uniref:hypothetical protein n=1 Tax=Ruegeria sp. HKCCD8929 TaxID=2683006 RepID=UPI00148918B5|nr:hypothetical protein [Ruegeria sp. HKCCD8929]
MNATMLALMLASPFGAAVSTMATGWKLRRVTPLRLTGTSLIALPFFVCAWILFSFFLPGASPAWLTQSWIPVLPIILSWSAIIGLLIRALVKGTAPVLAAISIVLTLVTAYVVFGVLYLG